MARARNIKPGLFKNEILGVADPLYTLLFEGLWLLADRDGRLEDRPLRIKAEIFPYREGLDMSAMLDWLQANGFIVREAGPAGDVIQIINPKQWYDVKTPETVNASGAARRARRRNALPAWADRTAIQQLYATARALSHATGKMHHVDHDIPLQADLVCGLHVPANLRVLTAEDNQKKSNKFEVRNG